MSNAETVANIQPHVVPLAGSFAESAAEGSIQMTARAVPLSATGPGVEPRHSQSPGPLRVIFLPCLTVFTLNRGLYMNI